MGIMPRDLFAQLQPHSQRARPPQVPQFESQAPAIWTAAVSRSRDDAWIEQDRSAYAYLHGRGLAESWEHRAFGVLGAGMKLPDQVADWPRRGYCIVAALHGLDGDLINLQARKITPGNPKTLLAKGSRARGTVFASRYGLDVLRGSSRSPTVIIGEGLTDFLALSIVASVPILCVPGSNFFESAMGHWARGKAVYLAADVDPAGNAAIGPAARAARRAGANDVFFLNWPATCKDACDALTKMGPIALAEFLERATSAGGGRRAVA
jgi:hypothetical protein